MMQKPGYFIVCLFSLTQILLAEPGPPPSRKAYLKSGRLERQDTVLNVKTFSLRGKLYEQPCFEVGENKGLYVRQIDGKNRTDQDQSPAIYVDGKEVLRFMWWGSFGSGQSGFPFPDVDKDKGQLTSIDRQAGTVVFEKKYTAPDQSRRTFIYTLKALKDSKIELSWSVGVSAEEMAAMPKPFGVALWYTMKNYRGTDIRVGGKKIVQANRQELIDRKRVVTGVGGTFEYNPDNPAGGFTLQFDDAAKGSLTETVYVPKNNADRYGMCCRQGDRPSGRLIIDLGKASVRSHAHPVVRGIDFWKIDNLHVPLSPVANLMPNPSFEQGLRYWRFTGGGARYTPGQGPRYVISNKARIGKKALLIRDTQRRAAALESFPLPLKKGATYTLSCYVRADRDCRFSMALASAARGGKFRGRYGTVFGDSGSPEATFDITNEWTRIHRTFTADGGGLQIILSGGVNTLVDGLLLEEAGKPGPFVQVPVEGMFTTSDPDNFILKGNAITPAFTFTGKAGASAEVTVQVKNAFGERVASESLKVTIPESGGLEKRLTFTDDQIGEGIFLVKAEFTAEGKSYTEYYRFSVMDPLDNTHATKDVFGTSLGDYVRIGRGEELAKKYMQWGFGSTSWGFEDNEFGHKVRGPLEKTYRFKNYLNSTRIRRDKKYSIINQFKSWTEVTPEMEKLIEESAYEKALHYDPEQYNIWAFGNEEESVGLCGQDKFDEYFKAQRAAAKGLKRARPDAIYTPTNGTTGYNKWRGYRGMEGYLKTAKKHNFKYDAISVHPYGSIDGGSLGYSDLDDDLTMLVEQMKRYGYGKETPIYLPEMFNVPETLVPEWGAGPAYDVYQAGKPSYDVGNREFIQASSIARLWIIALKYWPQLKSTNVWVSKPYLDYYQSPLLLAKVANTLGHHLPDVDYYATIKPAAGIRGYSFKLKDGTAVAAMWCVDHDVENGRADGPQVKVEFSQPVSFIDLMGNPRAAKAGPDGYTTVMLTPAPLLLKARDIEGLTTSLQHAIPNSSSSALKVAVLPSENGQISLEIQNLTAVGQSGKIAVSGATLDYALPASGKLSKAIPGEASTPEYGKLYQWKSLISVSPASGTGNETAWDMAYFYAPRLTEERDWTSIPAIPMTNHYTGKNYKGHPDDKDLQASFKVAWDTENLYLRLEAKDDHFVLSPKNWERGQAHTSLYGHDGCLEVYLDTGADGRTNSSKDFDANDYRYDFSIGRTGTSGPGMVYRLREVDKQLAQGLNMPTKEEAAEKIKNDFEVTKDGYAYTITFPKRYISPLPLEKGTVCGFGLYLHDKDDNETVGCPKGLSLATEKGSHCDHKPHLWPYLILND
jgi:hypothetical protein